MSKRTPSYCRHKATGQAVVRIDGKDYYLGKYGSPESQAEYNRLIAEWYANGQSLVPPSTGGDAGLTVNELTARFWPHAEQHYRHPDGTATNELDDFKYSLRPLIHLYGHTAAKDFGPLALKAVRQKMITGYEHPKYGPQRTLCRGVVNQRIGRIRRMFKWAVENELVPPSVLLDLQAVRGLQKGRSPARETEPVKPVPESFVVAILPHVRPTVAAMVQLQLLTGMRPGEVVIMRGIDLDMTGKVWLYRPGSDQGTNGVHKTAHCGHQRIIPIGPRGQELIRPLLKTDLYAYLFSPQETMDALRLKQRQQRKTKVQPSQMNRRKPKKKRKPGERYQVGSYAYAIARACEKARMPHFHPHQIRHTKATEIRREAGLDAARVVLGHRSPKITEVYPRST